MVTNKNSKTKKNVGVSSTKKTIAGKKIGASRKKSSDKSKVDRLKALSSIDVAKISKSESVLNKKNGNKKSGISAILVAILVVVIIAVLIIICLFNKNNNDVKTDTNVSETNILDNNTSSKFAEPEGASDVRFETEGDTINKLVYTKKVDSGADMTFVLRSAPSEEDLLDSEHTEGTPILMTVICKDESEVEVFSYVATDAPSFMRSSWFDNDIYYSMITDTLVTREDFLQEVNRVIIANHVSF